VEGIAVKSPILISLTVLLLAGCEKPEEKKSGISSTPKQEDRLKPTATPQPEAQPPKPVASPQELDAFYAEVQALHEKAVPILKNPAIHSDAPEVTALKEACGKLMEKRVKVTANMSIEQKKEVAKRTIALREVSTGLIELQMGKSGLPGLQGQEVLPPEPEAEGTPNPAPPTKDNAEVPAGGRRTPLPP